MAHFHRGFRQCPLTPFDLRLDFFCQMKGLIKLHKPGNFLEDKSLDSRFRDF